MIDTPVEFIDSLLKHDSSENSKLSGESSRTSLTERDKNQNYN